MVVGSAFLTLNPKPSEVARERVIQAAVDLMFDGLVSRWGGSEPNGANTLASRPTCARVVL